MYKMHIYAFAYKYIQIYSIYILIYNINILYIMSRTFDRIFKLHKLNKKLHKIWQICTGEDILNDP